MHPVLPRPLRSLCPAVIVAAAAALSVAVLTSAGLAADPDAVCQAYQNGKYDEAVSAAPQVLAGLTETAPRVEVYKCAACSFVALKQLPGARESMAAMLKADPTARFTPDYNYAPPVLEVYNLVRDSLFAGGTTAPVDIRTVAVGDFEDNSVYTGKFKDYDFSLFKNALVQTVIADLAQASTLKLVDRQRTDQILGEIKLGQSGFTDPDQSVKYGHLLGAQTFIFGQYMILSPKKVRIDARVVDTATGQIIVTKQVTGEFAGDPEKFLDLEKDLVMGIAQGIDQVITGKGGEGVSKALKASFDARSQDIRNRSNYLEAKFAGAQATDLENAGEYSAAVEKWQQVKKLDPENEVAGERLSALGSLAMNTTN